LEHAPPVVRRASGIIDGAAGSTRISKGLFTAREKRTMSVIAFFFYLFSSILLASAFMVIAARNPVHAVLFLILAFFNAAGLFLLLGAEFLAMLLIVVYVGAVAVLFLFVVMMLDVDFVELRQGFAQVSADRRSCRRDLRHRDGPGARHLEADARALSVGKEVSKATGRCDEPARVSGVSSTPRISTSSSLSGLILLVAMIGAIVLTLRDRPGVKRQDVMAQNARGKASAMDVKNVAPGQGV
jgi:NADH-quinone oxidoreductase subunit J